MRQGMLLRDLPKLGSEVVTPEGKGVVVNINMLKMLVRVRIEDKKKDLVTYHDFPADQLKFRRGKEKEEKDEGNEGEDLKEILD